MDSDNLKKYADSIDIIARSLLDIADRTLDKDPGDQLGLTTKGLVDQLLDLRDNMQADMQAYVPYNDLVSFIQNYITKDMEAAEPDYVREQCAECGMTPDILEKLGMGWINPEPDL